MKVLNFRHKFKMGNSIKVKKEYKGGKVNLTVGLIGIINKISIENYPTLGLLNVRVIYAVWKSKNRNGGENSTRIF